VCKKGEEETSEKKRVILESQKEGFLTFSASRNRGEIKCRKLTTHKFCE
jgi:hypothetical protein